MNEADKTWNEIQEMNARKTGFTKSSVHFSKRENAEKMLNSLLDGTMERVHDQLACLTFEAGSTVLDIGAGPGTLAVPLSAQGCTVTVVEPSEAMVECMEVYRQHMQVSSEIAVIPSVIEDLEAEDIGRFDYVISSFAMAVEDLKQTLTKMNAIAKKQVHIFWFVNTPSWAKAEEELRKLIRPQEPSARGHANLIWNCLYEEGIYANISIYPMKDAHSYSSPDEAVAEYTKRLSAETAEQKAMVSEYVSSHLQKTDDGYQFPENGKYAHIWWNTA